MIEKKIVYPSTLRQWEGQFSVGKGRPGVLLGEFPALPVCYFGPGEVRVT